MHVLAAIIAAGFNGYPVTAATYGISREFIESGGHRLWFVMILDRDCPADQMYGMKPSTIRSV
jgi:hypothetical protein